GVDAARARGAWGSAWRSNGNPWRWGRGGVNRGISRALPLLPGEACLSQDHRQKTQTDGSPVRIRYREYPLAPYHELVLASRVGALESETSQGGNELAALDRSPRGHQLAFLTSTLVLPSGGTRSPLATRTRTHSSTTSASWSRQASSVGPVAITP